MGRLIGLQDPWTVGHPIGPAQVHREATIVSLLMVSYAEGSKLLGHWGWVSQFYAEAASAHPGGLVDGSTGLPDVIARYGWIFGSEKPHRVYRNIAEKSPATMWSAGKLWSFADIMAAKYWQGALERDDKGATCDSPFDGKPVYVPLEWRQVRREIPEAG